MEPCPTSPIFKKQWVQNMGSEDLHRSLLLVQSRIDQDLAGTSALSFKAGLHSLNSMRGSVSVVTGAVDWISSDEVCVAAASSMM